MTKWRVSNCDLSNGEGGTTVNVAEMKKKSVLETNMSSGYKYRNRRYYFSTLREAVEFVEETMKGDY